MRLALLAVLLATGTASADDRGTPKREGEYGGVTPGQGFPNPKADKKLRRTPKGTLSWIGFEAKDGGAQLFFQSPGAFNVTQKLDKSTLVVTLNLARLGPNTWRQIDTRFFDNPLSGVVARDGGRKITVRISFKNPKDAREGSVTTKTEADGMFYAYLSFPEGADSKAQPTIQEPER